MLISCRGIQKNHHVIECMFLYEGNWGDRKLIEHEKFHKSLQNKTDFWLGFETSQFFKMSNHYKKRTESFY